MTKRKITNTTYAEEVEEGIRLTSSTLYQRVCVLPLALVEQGGEVEYAAAQANEKLLWAHIVDEVLPPSYRSTLAQAITYLRASDPGGPGFTLSRDLEKLLEHVTNPEGNLCSRQTTER